MSIHYRSAIHQDEDELFALAAGLATSFKLNKSDFSKTYHEILSSKDTDLIIAENEPIFNLLYSPKTNNSSTQLITPFA